MKSILAGCVAVCMSLAGCSSGDLSTSPLASEPQLADYTVSGEVLKSLSPAEKKIPVSVYAFSDQTGQHKPNDAMAQYSKAVTQGGLSILTQALLDVGQGKWFTVIERNGLNNLLQERKIIRSMRSSYAGKDGKKLPGLPPLLYAGMIIEGGIVSYESNTLTGGLGARYLGIGGSTEYRSDIVTIYLRAVQVTNGEILLSTNTSKTIYSTALQGGVYKFIGLNELLEIETGVTVNEPPQFAVRQAIEMGVYSLVMEGVEKNLWSFADKQAEAVALAQYRAMTNAKRRSFEGALEMAEMRSLPSSSKEAQQAQKDGDASLSAMLFSWFDSEDGKVPPAIEQAQMEAPKAVMPPPAAAPVYAPYPAPHASTVPQIQPAQLPAKASPYNDRMATQDILRKPVGGYGAYDKIPMDKQKLRKYLTCDSTGCVPSVK